MVKKHTEDRFQNPKLYNPYRKQRSPVFRWTGSVIPKVLPQTLLVTGLAVVVTVVYETTDFKPSIKLSFITVLGFVVSLLLAYRTNTAYDRYWEGRRLWSTMVVAIRNLTRFIWVNIDDKEPETKSNTSTNTETGRLVEKKTVINLLLGFAIATKHYLREEDACKYDDVKPYVSNIQSDLPGFRPEGPQDHEVIPKKKKGMFSGKSNKAELWDVEALVNRNMPLEITLYLSSYIRTQKKLGSTDDSTINLMNINLNILVDCLTNFERVLRSPIPLAYAIHLSHANWLYCLSIPFQFVADLHWVTIVVTFFAVLVLLGVEAIANEIENPFGKDENDLDLDDFCGILKKELSSIMAHKIPPMNEWVFTPENRLFTTDSITADEAKNLKADDFRILLEEDSKNIKEQPNKTSLSIRRDSSDTLRHQREKSTATMTDKVETV